MFRAFTLLSLACVVFALVVDSIHYLLNSPSEPFTGVVDDGMHLVLNLSQPAVLVLSYLLCLVALDRVRRARTDVPPLALVALVVAEVAYGALVPLRDVGASAYRLLFPEFLGGALIGVTSAFVARPVLHLRRVRWPAAAMLLLWVTGGVLGDLIWHLEGGARGSSPFWRLPGVGVLLTPFAFAFVVLGMPLKAGWGIELANWPMQRTLIGLVCVGIALAVTLSLPKGQRGIGLALSLAAMALFERVTEWAHFISD